MDEHSAVLISDNRLFREGIRRILENRQISVGGEGRDIPELLRTMADDVRPDLIMFHLGPSVGAVSLELMHSLSERFADAKLIILADPSARHLFPSFVSAGASAILLTEISITNLERSLELVFSDHRLFPADVMSSVTGAGIGREPAASPHPVQGCGGHHDYARNALAGTSQPAGTGIPLSRRERQVLRCLANGLPNKVIARELNITEGTVKVHVKGLLRKTTAHNRTQLAIWALHQAGRFSADEDDDHDDGTEPLEAT